MGMQVGGAGSVDWSAYGLSPNEGFGVAPTEDGEYQVFGDEGPSGPGKKLTEDEVNALLQASGAGYIFVNGVRVETDTVERTGGKGGGSIDSGDPVLPGVGGPTAGGSGVSNKARWMADSETSGAALMWSAMLTMARSAMREQKMARELRDAAQDQKINAKSAEIKATQEKINAEKGAAETQFWFSVGAACVTAACAAGGAALGSASTVASTTLSAAAGAMGSVTTAAGNWWSKTSGPQARADQKQVEAMRQQQMQEMLDQTAEDEKSNYDEAHEQMKAALKVITDYHDMQLQTTSKILQ